MADLQAELAASPTPDTPAVETPTVEPQAENAAPETPTVEVPPPAAPIEVKLPNEDEIPSDPEELKKGWLRHRDYTKKTMSLAEERKAIEAERQRVKEQEQYFQRAAEEIQAWRTLANDPDQLAQFVERQRAARNQPAPDEPLTWQQTQQLLAQERERIRAEVAAETRNELLKLEAGRAEVQFFQELTTHTNDLLTKNPLLRTVPRIERLIVEDARARNPQSLAELKQFMVEEAEERVKPLAQLIKNHEDAAVMRYAKAQKPSMAPAGGTLPAAQAPTRQPKLGSPEFYKQIEQDLLLELEKK